MAVCQEHGAGKGIWAAGWQVEMFRDRGDVQRQVEMFRDRVGVECRGCTEEGTVLPRVHIRRGRWRWRWGRGVSRDQVEAPWVWSPGERARSCSSIQSLRVDLFSLGPLWQPP